MKLFGILMSIVLFAGMAAAKEATTQVKVSGMTCRPCAVGVRAMLNRVKGVKSANVDADKSLATIVYDDSQVTEQQLVEAINKTGFKAESSKGNK